MKKAIVLFVILSLCTGFICDENKDSSSPMESAPVQSVEGLIVTPDSLSLRTGDSSSLAATAYYSNGSAEAIDGGIQWFSSDINICAVNDQGVVTGISPGRAGVTGLFQECTDITWVTVTASQGDDEQDDDGDEEENGDDEEEDDDDNDNDGWVTVFSDDFEKARLYPRWETFRHSGGYRWGITDWIAVSGNQCAWSVGDADDGYNDIDPDAGPYTNNVESWMVLKYPVDLRNCREVRLAFKTAYWTEEGYDYVKVYAASGDKNWLYIDKLTGRSPHKVNGEWVQWQNREYFFTEYDNVKTLLGHSVVYLAFQFYSDASNAGYSHRLRGVFVDDVVLEKRTG